MTDINWLSASISQNPLDVWHTVTDEDDFTTSEHYTTIEVQDLFSLCFPQIVSQYSLAQEQSKAGKKKKGMCSLYIQLFESDEVFICDSVQWSNNFRPILKSLIVPASKVVGDIELGASVCVLVCLSVRP